MPDTLARRIGLFDATMVVMGGIVGTGIFVTPATVARETGSSTQMLIAWLIGGAAAMLGAFVYAELATRRPLAGGQYVYLREAMHPGVAFLYGWALLLVIQTGGMAACAIGFARYFTQLVPLGIPEGVLAAIAMGALTLINCAGVAAGSRVQSVLMVLKIAALATLIACGFLAHPAPVSTAVTSGGLGAALIAVLFSYGGWQTACFVAGEMKEPRRDLPRALILGVIGVIALYTLVALACDRALGIGALMATTAPASEVATRFLGPRGASFIAACIAISTLGFLSQSMLTAPRVYFAMAEDRVFFRAVARVSEKTRVPVVAIVLQGIVAMLVALTGTFDSILRTVVAMDFVFFALTAACIFVFRKRDKGSTAFAMPGHPFTTLAFIGICLWVIVATFVREPADAAKGWLITLAGLPVFWLWSRRRTP